MLNRVATRDSGIGGCPVAKAGIATLLRRLPGLRFDPEQPRPEIVGRAFRGPERLPVVFEPSR